MSKEIQRALRNNTNLSNLNFDEISNAYSGTNTDNHILSEQDSIKTDIPNDEEDSEAFHGFNTPSTQSSPISLSSSSSTIVLKTTSSVTRKLFNTKMTDPSTMTGTEIKADWDSKKKGLETTLDELEDLIDNFDSLVDTFYLEGDLKPVDAHWKNCTTNYLQMRNVEKGINKFNATTLKKETDTEAQINTFKTRIAAVKNEYQKHNETYRACCSKVRQAQESKGVTKKEEIKIPTFDPDTSDWESWSKLMISEAANYDNEQMKMNFLRDKLMRAGKDLLIHHRTFEDCLVTLKGTYGDPIKITNERINAFIKWAQESVTSISKPDKISEDVAKLSGLAARLVKPRDKVCKCPNKTNCTSVGHKENDHCRNHCEFDTLKEDSDKLHSIIIAIAGSRLPTQIVETVGAQVRQTEKIEKRTLDVKKYVELLTEHINNMKIARSSINQKGRGDVYKDDVEQANGYPPRMGTRNEVYGRNDSSTWKFQPSGQRGHSFGSSRFNNGRASNDIICFYCSGPHRLFNCNTAKNDDYRSVLRKIQEAGACTLCMSPSHHATNCNRKGEQSCEYCRSKNIAGHNTHHVVVCPKKPKREQVNIGGEVETSLPEEFYD